MYAFVLTFGYMLDTMHIVHRVNTQCSVAATVIATCLILPAA